MRAVLFIKGALLKDTHGLLVQQTDNVQVGRQRAYLYYFSQPKQSKTRISRIEKYIPSILDGKSLND
ncbi:YdeI/OmpD-associated family protein [Paenibacillus silvae]|nr:YdeI/OmpD-associated family protein [Paenibacillus silvae]MCK6149486.1 YdeI/OmpD-associated family protein [Paenibacillus silvae]MCK6267785.1 YdeI/OmpD-associated family protein [Paenibacillus silvae]